MTIAGYEGRIRTRAGARHCLAAGALFLAAFVFLLAATCGAPARGQDMQQAERSDAVSVTDDLREFSEYVAMPETLMYKMRGAQTGFVVVDLREPARFAAGHLRGAVSSPWKGGVFLSECGKLPRNKEIFLVSDDGGYGLEALRVLVNAGFSEVYSVEGGMRNWPYSDLIEKP